MDEMKSKPRPRKTTAKSARPAAQKAAPAKAAPAKRPSRAPAQSPAQSPAEREGRVRMAAYFRAERRGFAPGYETEDWLAAEAEVGGSEQSRPAAKPRKAPVRKPRSG